MIQKVLTKYWQQLKDSKLKYYLMGVMSYTLFGIISHHILTGPFRNKRIIAHSFLNKKVVIVTGSSAGIGKEAARALAQKGAVVIFGCRNKMKTNIVMEQIKSETKNDNLFYIHLDLENQESIHRFAEVVNGLDLKIDILINNAGIADYDLSHVNGIEKVFAVNQLGWFTLTTLLLPHMNQQGRVINVASQMHRVVTSKVDWQKAISGELKQRYGLSKYAMVSCTKEYQKRLEQSGKDIKIVSLCPGGVRTEIYSKSYSQHKVLKFLVSALYVILWPFSLSEKEGAMTILYCALQPYDTLLGGSFYHMGREGSYSKYVESLNQGKEIYDLSMSLCKLG